ncbi:sensor domain-containing diguanylate cyclase [Bacillus sp. FJAT-45066]|uniref:sensor domain-containing diguanylate cyclase n=1 Tax=Bacillus sp. FJAT-45066 TaxID=2011010 RepID=UPI0020D11C49|nr:diguanylate cyclase [Bacillus sp. FJAT-45066]
MNQSKMSLKQLKMLMYDYFLHSEIFDLETINVIVEDFLKENMEVENVKVISCNDKELFIKEPNDLINAYQNKYSIPLIHNEVYEGELLLHVYKTKKIPTDYINELSKELALVLNKVKKLVLAKNEQHRYEQLYRVTSKFHSTMEINTILSEIFATLRNMYNDYTYFLMLTSDYDNLQNLPVKRFNFDEGDSVAMQAYVTGEVQLEDSIKEKRSYIYIPLKGKQGIYGVLQIIAVDAVVFPKEEIMFITLLANTAGTAFENAQLYQQSRQSISDLRLINEASHQLNTNLRLSEVTAYLYEKIMDTFQAKELGFLVCSRDGRKTEQDILEGSTSFFEKENANVLIDYVRQSIIQQKEPIFISDTRSNPTLKDLEFYSCIVIPMELSNDKIGACIVGHTLPYFFSFDQFKLLQSLIHHSTLAFSNSMLREELEKFVITDYLTRLRSRKYLDEKIQVSMKNDSFGTFLLVDIDDFKLVNDRYGHQVGDDILIQVANIIKENIRDTDIAARWGGEELAIYLPKVDLSLGTQIAERVLTQVTTKTTPTVSISCGISYWEKGDSITAKELFLNADSALYEAKETGKNKYCIQKENTAFSS